MEKFSELIRIRRSMRKFTEEELNQDEVVALLRAALISPSSKGVRPWEFVVVDNKELLQQLAHCKEHGAELVEGAPLAVVVLADPTQSDVWVEDASVATTMMLLQAEDLGLGACWVQIRNRTMADGKPAEEMVCSQFQGHCCKFKKINLVSLHYLTTKYSFLNDIHIWKVLAN